MVRQVRVLEDPSAGEGVPEARLRHALRVVARIERQTGALPRKRQRFRLDGARADALEGGQAHAGLSGRLLGTAGSPVLHTPARKLVVAPTGADIVTTRVLAHNGQLRVRAFYEKEVMPSTLVAHEQLPQERTRVQASVEALRALAGRSAFVIPEVHTHGVMGRFDYAVETLIEGVHPVGAAAKSAAIERLVPQLFATYREVGVSDVPWTEALPAAKVAARVSHMARSIGAPDWPSWTRDIEGVLDALDPTWTLPASTTHGDLVFSNMMETPGGDIALIDWELSAHMPVAFDVGKLIAVGPAVSRHAEEVCRHLDALGGFRSAPGEVQLGLGLLRYLSSWERRWSRQHNDMRRERLRANILRQLEQVAALLSVGSTPEGAL